MRSFLILFLAIPALSFAQSSMDEIKRNVYGNPFSDANQTYIRMMESNSSMGNTKELFLLEDWGKMVVQGVDKQKLEVDSANYVIPDDKIYFIDNGQLYHLFPGQVDMLAIGEVLFGAYKYNNKPRGEMLGYFEVLIDGELDLLKKHVIKNRKKYANPMGIGNKTVEQYKDSEMYYFDPEEEIALPIPKKKTDIISLFGRKRSKMIEFARKRDLSLKSEEDVRLLFSYYNMLMEVQAKQQN